MSKPAAGGKPEGSAAPSAPKHESSAPAPTKGKGHTPAPGGCFCWGCKHSASRFNFCDEHYDHFKFGLIKKTGEPVPDYERKFEHFQAFKAKQKAAHKVA